MKKVIVSIAAVAAFAIVPSSAMAVPSQWSGWSTSHDDNAASPTYWTHFGSSGTGDSHYCLNPGGADNSCSGGVDTGLYSTGYLNLTNTPLPSQVNCLGCAHGTTTPGQGGIYVGTGIGGTPTGVLTGGPEGIGLQGP